MAADRQDRGTAPETRQLRQYKAQGFDGGTAVALAAQMNEWFATAGEKVKIEIHVMDGASALILYTE